MIIHGRKNNQPVTAGLYMKITIRLLEGFSAWGFIQLTWAEFPHHQASTEWPKPTKRLTNVRRRIPTPESRQRFPGECKQPGARDSVVAATTAQKIVIVTPK